MAAMLKILSAKYKLIYYLINSTAFHVAPVSASINNDHQTSLAGGSLLVRFHSRKHKHVPARSKMYRLKIIAPLYAAAKGRIMAKCNTNTPHHAWCVARFITRTPIAGHEALCAVMWCVVVWCDDVAAVRRAGAPHTCAAAI